VEKARDAQIQRTDAVAEELKAARWSLEEHEHCG